ASVGAGAVIRRSGAGTVIGRSGAGTVIGRPGAGTVIGRSTPRGGWVGAGVHAKMGARHGGDTEHDEPPGSATSERSRAAQLGNTAARATDAGWSDPRGAAAGRTAGCLLGAGERRGVRM